MNGYWADWTSSIVPPESVDWNRFDVINYAFAEPSYDGRLEFTQANSASLLKRLVASAHSNGKKVVLSVGGWTGSAHFSSIVADQGRSQTFIDNIVAAINEYNLDGIDLDWEYPGVPGAGGNSISPDDSANYIVFLRKLRQAVPQNSLITAATQVWPFAGPDGRPMSDVSAFAEVFDWILLMNYDIWGSSASPGPNAPLADGCKDSSQPTANAYAAVASWVAAGFPADKITLGVAAYGYVQRSQANQLQHRRSYPPQKRQVTVANGDGGTADGQITFRGLVQQGALSNNGGNFDGAGGFTRNWDECSSTPWLKSASSGQIITYDDPQSLNMKGQFAAQAGIRGCSMWSVDGDFIDGAWPLTDAVRSGMGI
jgi:chitinase